MKVKSEHIQVYPTAFRDKVGTRNYNPESRLNTEFNLTNRFRFLGNDNYAASGSKSGSFVVSWDSTSKILIFLIHGYYFKATLSANDYSSLFSSPSNGDTIWGQIKILPFTTSEDSNTKYKAFTLVNTDASGSTTAGAALDNIPSGESVAKFEGLSITRGTEPSASGTTYTLALLTYNSTSSKWEIPETSKLIIPSTAVKNTDGSPIHRKFTTDELNVAGVTVTTGPSSSVPLKISAGTLVDGNFEATGSSKIGGSEEVTGDLQVWQDLDVDGDADVGGTVAAGGHVTAQGHMSSAGYVYSGDYIQAVESVEGKKVYASNKDGLRFNTGGCYDSSGRPTVRPGALPLPIYDLDDGYRIVKDESGGSYTPTHTPTTPITLAGFISKYNLPATSEDEVFILNYSCGNVSITERASYMGGGYSETVSSYKNTYLIMFEKTGSTVLYVRIKCIYKRTGSDSSSYFTTPVDSTTYRLYWSGSGALVDQTMQNILDPNAWATNTSDYTKIRGYAVTDLMKDFSTKNINIERVNNNLYGVRFGTDYYFDDTKESITHLRIFCTGEYRDSTFGFGFYYGGNTTYYNYVDHTGEDTSVQSQSIPGDCVWTLADIYVKHTSSGSGSAATHYYTIYGTAWYDVKMKDYSGNEVYIRQAVGINVGRSFTPPGSGSYHAGFTITGSGGGANIPFKISEQVSSMYIPVSSLQYDPTADDPITVSVGSSTVVSSSVIQVFPSDATNKSFRLVSQDDSIAIAYQSTDYSGTVWRVKGISAGTVDVRIISEDNPDIVNTLHVSVS